MAIPSTSVSRRLLSLAVSLPLFLISIPSVYASTATISKHVAVPLPKIQKQGAQYVMSSFREYNGGSEELDEIAVAKKNHSSSLKGVYEWYMEACVRKPFLAKGLTSATIAALGDVIAQNIEGFSAKAFCPSRVATFFFCNLLFTGPFIHLWYTFLNVVGGWMDKNYQVSKMKKTVTQVFLDQTLGTFAFFPLYIFVYDMFDSIIRMRSLPSMSRAADKCRNHLWGIIMTQYRVFPFSNMINFGLVPYEMRVLFTSTVSLFWNIYLCSVVG